jgi:hypothetical protein
MPLQATSGAASYDAFGGGVPVVPTFVEDVFSTTLYTGNSSTQTITNGIDLSGKGGLVWIKNRPNAGYDHALFDTSRGVNKQLKSNSTAAEVTYSGSLTAFTSSGFSLGADTAGGYVNDSLTSHVSWTFRKQPKFFDVVTYTGNGTANRQISHALGSTPGCVIVKNTTDAGTGWIVWHRSINGVSNLFLNTTDSVNTLGFEFLVGTDATVFTITTAVQALNQSGKSYVAYLFAHNAGGFGLTGTDNVISCGSFTQSIGGFVNLGFEPQWVLTKRTSGVDDWRLFDNMRGMTMGDDSLLNPNLSAAENNSAGNDYLNPQPTGFTTIGFDSGTHIYIAIRRGPMKVPTTGTSVFTPQIATVSGSASNTVTTNFPVDLTITQVRNGYFAEWLDRLRGDSQSTYVRFRSANTSVEATGAFGLGFDNNTGYVDNYNWQNFGGGPFVYWNFRRAPSFFDIVSYTCNDQASAITSNHNLNVIPEMMIVKKRAAVGDWSVYHKDLNGGVTPQNYRIRLNATNAAGAASGVWNNTAPTSTQFTVGTDSDVNSGTGGALAYLFATCAGVSKVGSYTGTGTTQVINCGFTAGSRFIMIKRTDSTGDWYVWDSARGIVAGNDPYLLLNSTAAEVTGTDYVDTAATGFEISSTAPAAINANGGSFIFLAIA